MCCICSTCRSTLALSCRNIRNRYQRPTEHTYMAIFKITFLEWIPGNSTPSGSRHTSGHRTYTTCTPHRTGRVAVNHNQLLPHLVLCHLTLRCSSALNSSSEAELATCTRRLWVRHLLMFGSEQLLRSASALLARLYAPECTESLESLSGQKSEQHAVT